MIRFEHVTRRYEPGGRPALDDVSVEFLRGEFVFLIGASGSGKSTLLRMIVREGLPQQGKITVAGQNLGLMLEHRVPAYRRSIGMVFQDFRLLPDKTVHDNVAFAMRVTGASRARIRQRVPEVLEKVGLSELSRRLPHEISGGEQQRAAIARAMVHEPAVLLADEPTGNLDPHASDEVVRVLRRIHAAGTTVIMATHDRAIVDRAGRRVVQLHDGRIVRDEQRGTYDPRPGTEAWELLRDVETTGTLRPIDPRAAAPDAPESPGATSAAPSAEAGGGGAPGAPAAAAALAAPGGKPVDEPLRPPQRRGPQGGADASAPGGQSAAEQAAETSAPTSAAVQVSWPAHLRARAAGEDVPEPTGDFTGSELPDLDRDGFVELESPARGTGGAAAGGSAAGEPSAQGRGPASSEGRSAPSAATGSTDSSGSTERPFLGRSTRNLPPEPTSVPKLSDVGWLANSGPPLPFRSASSAGSAASAASPRTAEPDPAEDLAEDPGEDPAEDPGEDPAELAASEEREHDVIEDAVAEHSPHSAGPDGEAAQPQTSWLPHADGRSIARPGVAHTVSAPSPQEPDVEDRRLAAQSTEDEPPVADPSPDAHPGRGPEPDRRLQARRRAARPMAGRERASADDDAGADADAGADDGADGAGRDGGVPGPTPSPAQATDEDARRTADQLGGRRSIWRRLRRK